MTHIALFAVLQGVGTGILSTLSYAYAVRCLGSSIPAATGAVSPVLTTLLAVPLFSEPITAGHLLRATRREYERMGKPYLGGQPPQLRQEAQT